jgi:hypothetical protein
MCEGGRREREEMNAVSSLANLSGVTSGVDVLPTAQTGWHLKLNLVNHCVPAELNELKTADTRVETDHGGGRELAEWTGAAGG